MEAPAYTVTPKGSCLFPDEDDHPIFEIACRGRTVSIIQANLKGAVFFQMDVHDDAEPALAEHPQITPQGVLYLAPHAESGGLSLARVFFDPEKLSLRSEVVVQAVPHHDPVLVLWAQNILFWVIDGKPQAMPFDQPVREGGS